MYWRIFCDTVYGICFSSQHKGEASSKTKEMYLVTEMYQLTENGKPKESHSIQPHIQTKKDETDEKGTDSDIGEPAPITMPSVDG